MAGRAEIILVAVMATSLLPAGARGQQAEEPSPSTLAGVWHLDKSHSEAPGAPKGMSWGHGRFGARGDGMGGRHGGMRPGNGLAPGDRSGSRGTAGLLGGEESIKLDVQGDEVRIISADGHVRIITLDGQPIEREREFMTVTETARWQDGKIVVTSSTDKGLAITETFALAEDGSGRLVHTIQVGRPDATTPRTARWVYDPAPGEQ